jgi:fluoride exporter
LGSGGYGGSPTAGREKEQTLNFQLVAAVAIGGAIGSVARYLVAIGSGKLFGLSFPWGTLIINIVGSFLIGAFVESFALKWDAPQAARAFLTVGICGGFTTFSTFSLDSYLLIDRGQWGPAAFYMIGSVVLGFAGLMAGLHLVRSLS